ncbi:MAG: Na(+)-translocating NADH-quinone reductase subunit C [Halobacteriovoraceae bacterium]|nr:Na(+)-translocating NADH-quinone reductase subunit C [Halobacteriovoraceae bacterium]MCB9094073.1 Na(+)-translocating NADH-quinone reductase subunit C [Halobacteriovoraceae bacterium]
MSESPIKTIVVAFLLCVVCSVMVSSTAVFLKPAQDKNKELDMKKNILSAAGLYEEGVDIEEKFNQIETVVIDFDTGLRTEAVDPESYDMVKAEKKPDLNEKIPSSEDVAKLSKRPKYAKLYLLKGPSGEIQEIILPIKSIGLWSKMYGFLALENDTKTVKGFAYYAQGETPGLGAEVQNPKWKKQWIGKELYNSNWEPVFNMVKGGVQEGNPEADHQVDALSGATITTHGVESSIHYWLGQNGYGPFLSKIRSGEFQ